MHQFKIDKFEGPLDLLLQLIEKNELKITEISLAAVTDQYLAYIGSQDSLPSAEVADFLLIASKLIYLKSRHLLPDFDMAAEEDGLSLEKQLKIYRQYHEASKHIDKLFKNKKFGFVRQLAYKPVLAEKFMPPTSVSGRTLAEIFALVLDKIDKVVKIPQIALTKAISIAEKISHLRDLIKNSSSINFSELFAQKKDKVEIVVSFLAMLELVKQKEVAVSQDELFGNLIITRQS